MPAVRRRPSSPTAVTAHRQVPTVNEAVLPLESRTERATLTVIHGPETGTVFQLSSPHALIGRDPEADVFIDDPAISRRHAAIERREDGEYFLRDLGSTNGTFIGAQRIALAQLVPGARIQVGPHALLRFALFDETEEELQKRLYAAATRDALTGLFNRRSLIERLTFEIAFTRRNGTPLSVLVLDLDGFKAVNDTLGHLAGDELLRRVGEQLVDLLRSEDVLARWGGDEFVAVLRETPASQAVAVAERLRSEIAGNALELRGQPTLITASIGVATFAECPRNAGAEELLALADERLYRAKFAGRNCVCHDTMVGRRMGSH